MRRNRSSKLLAMITILGILMLSIPAAAGAITINEVNNNTIMAGNDFWPITSAQLTTANINAAYGAAGVARTYYKHANGMWFNVIHITQSADLTNPSKALSTDTVKALKNLGRFNKTAGTEYFGPIIDTVSVQSGSGLTVSNGASKPGGIAFTASENAANPIGVLTFVFDRNINKNLDTLKIYINGQTTEPANAALIKSLLFNKFGTNANDDAKTLTGSNIPLTVSALKQIMIDQYGVTPDTANKITIKFEIKEDTASHTPATSYITLVL